MDAEQHATLPDGSLLVIRGLRSADAPAVEAGFARLSAESRRLRFLSPKPRLSTAELRYLGDVDGHLPPPPAVLGLLRGLVPFRPSGHRESRHPGHGSRQSDAGGSVRR